MRRFTTTLHHNGVFIQNPFKYVHGETYVIKDINFEGMSVNQLREIIDRFVNGSPKTYYYAKPGTTLVRGIIEFKSESDIDDFMTLGYQNGFKIDLYAEHHGYDVMVMVRDDNFPRPDAHLIEDHASSDEEDNGNFIGIFDDRNPHLEGTYVEEDDPEDDIVDMKYKVKPGISYPTFNPATPWNEQKPILGIKYENPLQLKQSLANYGVTNGRCAIKRKSKGVRLTSTGPSKNEKTHSKDKGKGVANNEKTPSKGKGKRIADESQPESANTPTKWTKEKIKRVKDTPSSHYYSFRLWASWMSSGKSFQIKSLTLITSVLGTITWGPWLHINGLLVIILGQCKRAKQCTMYDHGGRLVEHYSKLWEYRLAMLESNLGSTCYLDVKEDDGCVYFKRFYVCFKGLKDGWKAGCKRVIGIDGSFLTHTCKGELLTAMGRDANNQMFPVAWAVVGVENTNNWAWFLSLLSDDLDLDDGDDATIISDGHKGLLEVVRAAAATTIRMNDISESFNSRILVAKGKPIITKLEDIKLNVMQRTWAISKVVYPSDYQVMEVRKGDEAYGVNLINRTCNCGMWSLSGIPCVHSVAAYMHCKQNADVGVSEWMWKRNNNVPLLPPIIRKMLGRPRTRRIRHPTKGDHHVSRAGRPITCQDYCERGHNKGSCKNPSRPKPPSDIQPPKKRKLGGSSVPGKGDGSSHSKVKKGGNGDGTSPSKTSKGGKCDGSGPSKAKKGGNGDGTGPSKTTKGVQLDKGGPSKAKKGGININEGQHMTSSQEELFRQDQVVLEKVIHEEERRKQMEWESNRRMYETWSDHEQYNQHDPWEDERSPDDMQLFHFSDVSA
ncbi:calcium/proton exchanger [Tanacetum coccineum]|uniref:Calcium/proton exchanger n=1 Tax=Tanacetum coccineum TaxID=301880 RepID=A0ABQ4ZHT5_9ASTR